MSNHKQIVGVLFVSAALSMATATADAGQGRGRGADKHDKHDKDDKDKKAEKGHDATHVVVVDRDGHVRVIREYARAGSLPPCLAKREALPPGLREQLHENGSLPPGLQKRLVPVPAPLVVRLPGVPSYYHRYFIGDDLIVIDGRTNRIVSVLRDVWR
jgi:hypothetical protein